MEMQPTSSHTPVPTPETHVNELPRNVIRGLFVFAILAAPFVYRELSTKQVPTSNVPDDLTAIIATLDELATAGTSSQPLYISQEGNVTNIYSEPHEGAVLLGGALNAAPIREGTYFLVGVSADGVSRYTGTVDLYMRLPGIYDLTWSIGGAQQQSGVGIVQDNILSVGYTEVRDGDVVDVGVVSFALVGEGVLEGPWASIRGGGSGLERLTWQVE